jgi:hypothetical protein
MRSLPHIIAIITITLFGSLSIVPIATVVFPEAAQALTDAARLLAASAIPCIVLCVFIISTYRIVKGA